MLDVFFSFRRPVSFRDYISASQRSRVIRQPSRKTFNAMFKLFVLLAALLAVLAAVSAAPQVFVSPYYGGYYGSYAYPYSYGAYLFR